jgi:hypothetical protein
LLVLAGRNPYVGQAFMNPPWVLIPLLPFALLPERVGRAALVVVSLGTLGYTAHRLGLSPSFAAVWLLSPPVLASLYAGNLEWLVLAGMILPHWLGITLLALKPQVGGGIILLWAIEAYMANGWHAVARLLAPTAALFALSFLAFGAWPAYCERPANPGAAAFPLSLLVGLPLLWLAIRRRDERLALAATPYLSPYAMLHSWSGMLLGVSETGTLAVAVAALWAAGVSRAF